MLPVIPFVKNLYVIFALSVQVSTCEERTCKSILFLIFFISAFFVQSLYEIRDVIISLKLSRGSLYPLSRDRYQRDHVGQRCADLSLRSQQQTKSIGYLCLCQQSPQLLTFDQRRLSSPSVRTRSSGRCPLKPFCRTNRFANNFLGSIDAWNARPVIVINSASPVASKYILSYFDLSQFLFGKFC